MIPSNVHLSEKVPFCRSMARWFVDIVEAWVVMDVELRLRSDASEYDYVLIWNTDVPCMQERETAWTSKKSYR